MKNLKLCFIGAGNMASALIGGLISDDGISPENIIVTDVNDTQLSKLEEKYGVSSCGNNSGPIVKADVVVLCVKPQLMSGICQEIVESVLASQPLVISVAAGITTENIKSWLGEKTAVVRCMPNTPALITTGATGLFANENVSDEQKITAENILRSVGIVVWVETEKEIDYVTALSGSGPAYFFRMMESMENAAVNLGLSKDVAHLLTLQTALGAAKLAMESEESIAELREKVTSPGGTTEQGLLAMNNADIDGMFKNTLQAASDRAEVLSKEFGES